MSSLQAAVLRLMGSRELYLTERRQFCPLVLRLVLLTYLEIAHANSSAWLCLKELGKSRGFGSGWAGKVVGELLGRTMCLCRHEVREAPAPCLLSRLTRSVSRVHSWAVMVNV